MTQMSDKCLLCKYWKTQISGQTQIIWVFWDLWADQEEDTPLYRWHGILSLKAGLQPFPWSDLRKSLSWTSLWWNTFKILLLNCWSLTITRHLAMIPIVQKLVWWSFEIRPTPHKTKHEIWNQKNENVIFVTASWCITRVSDTSITCHWQELKRCRKYWLMPFIFIPCKSWVAFLQGFLSINPSGRVNWGNFSFWE